MRNRAVEPKPEVYVQALIAERQRTYLMKESRKRGCTFSDLVRIIIDNAIKDDRLGKVK